MTQQEYTAALATYIPKAEAWADKEVGIIPSHRKAHKTRWERHYSFAMDEARRRLGRRMSYDVKPELFRPPHQEAGANSLYEIARMLVASKTYAEFVKNCRIDVKTAKAKFGASRYVDAAEKAAEYLERFDIGAYMKSYRESVAIALDGAATP